MDWICWLLAAVGVFLVLRWWARPHTLVRFAGGRAIVVRGQLPSALIGDLLDLAAAAPSASGVLTLGGRGTDLIVRTAGLDERFAQRIRNVVFLHRSRIAAPGAA